MRGGAGGGGTARELVQLETYLSLNLFSWMRADTRVESGGKVTQFTDRVVASGGVAPNARSVDPAHAFAQGNSAMQVVAITTNALVNNREVATFNNFPLYDSTIAAANWKAHDGTGWEIFAAWVPKTTVGTQTLWSTRPATVLAEHGAMLQLSTGIRVAVANGAAHTYETGVVGSLAVDAPTYCSFSYQESASPEVAFRQKTTTVSSGASAVAPSASDGATMRIGGSTGGVALLNSLLMDCMWVNRVDATLRAKVQRYFALRYPVLA